MHSNLLQLQIFLMIRTQDRKQLHTYIIQNYSPQYYSIKMYNSITNLNKQYAVTVNHDAVLWECEETWIVTVVCTWQWYFVIQKNLSNSKALCNISQHTDVMGVVPFRAGAISTLPGIGVNMSVVVPQHRLDQLYQKVAATSSISSADQTVFLGCWGYF
jgi:hypothetical protein